MWNWPERSSKRDQGMDDLSLRIENYAWSFWRSAADGQGSPKDHRHSEVGIDLEG